MANSSKLKFLFIFLSLSMLLTASNAVSDDDFYLHTEASVAVKDQYCFHSKPLEIDQSQKESTKADSDRAEDDELDKGKRKFWFN